MGELCKNEASNGQSRNNYQNTPACRWFPRILPSKCSHRSSTRCWEWCSPCRRCRGRRATRWPRESSPGLVCTPPPHLGNKIGRINQIDVRSIFHCGRRSEWYRSDRQTSNWSIINRHEEHDWQRTIRSDTQANMYTHTERHECADTSVLSICLTLFPIIISHAANVIATTTVTKHNDR